MRSTYARAMTGSKVTAPPVKRRWVYLTVAALIVASALLARAEAAALFTHPVGFAAILAITAGFFATKSMALTPWGLVCGSLVLYGIEHGTDAQGPGLASAQLALLAAAVVTAVFQLRIEMVGGQAALRPSRTRWGSVLVSATACLLVLILSRPDVLLVEWIRSDRVPREPAPISRSDYERPRRVDHLQDPTITESSGLVASRRNDGLLWTHNDSGNAPYIYCLHDDGASCGTWEVSGATNRDWEDIAAGPGPHAGSNYLYIGDIGDNERAEEAITVYRIAEPLVTGTPPGLASTETAVALKFRYPDDPHDAETLLVHPDSGDLYIVTKEIDPGVYRASAPFGPAPIRLEKVGEFSIFANFSDPTGGDISPDGHRVAIATYGGWYELSMGSGLSADPDVSDFDEVWRSIPALIGTAPAGQWEAIAYGSDGRTVFMTAEGDRAPIYEAKRENTRATD